MPKFSDCKLLSGPGKVYELPNWVNYVTMNDEYIMFSHNINVTEVKENMRFVNNFPWPDSLQYVDEQISENPDEKGIIIFQFDCSYENWPSKTKLPVYYFSRSNFNTDMLKNINWNADSKFVYSKYMPNGYPAFIKQWKISDIGKQLEKQALTFCSSNKDIIRTLLTGALRDYDIHFIIDGKFVIIHDDKYMKDIQSSWHY